MTVRSRSVGGSLEGYAYVAEAHEALCNDRLPPRPRLERAADAFWRALPHFDLWPQPVRQKALTVTGRLFDRGSLPRTIARMTDADVERALHKLEEFTRAFLEGDGNGSAPAP